MKKNIISNIIAAIAIFVGLIVMTGWFLDIQILKSILPGWVTMKFTTSLCFIASGLILYAVSFNIEGKKKDLSEIIIITSALFIFIIMGLLVLSGFFGVRTGIEDLFVKETFGAIKTTTPGRPSLFTMLNFIMIGFSGLLFLGQKFFYKMRIVSVLGVIISLFGFSAVLGYLLNRPVLYFFIKGLSSAMAMHTAILFVLIGIGFFVLSFYKSQDI